MRLCIDCGTAEDRQAIVRAAEKRKSGALLLIKRLRDVNAFESPARASDAMDDAADLLDELFSNAPSPPSSSL